MASSQYLARMPQLGAALAVSLTILSSTHAVAEKAASVEAAKPAAAKAIVESVAPPTDLLAGLPPYLPKAPVAGEITIAGSSAMNQLARLWADGLKHVHPELQASIEMFESGQVLPRLSKGEMQIGLMSRPLTEQELKSNGVVALATAKDVLGVVVHPDNPLELLTIDQGVQILRDPQATDQPGAKTWGQLGLKGEWAALPITLYGRTAGAGAWGYLTNRFLGEGAATRTGKDCSGYAEICKTVATDRGGVGYLSLCLAPPKAGKVLPLVLDTGEVVPAPAYGEPVDPRYPLVRPLFVVLKWDASKPLSPAAEELLRYVLSRSGQEDAIKSGFLPLRRDEVMASRDQLGWTGVR